MNKRACLRIGVIFVILLTVLIYPFMPGDYDPLSLPLAIIVQLYSGLGLLTVIPATLWLLRNIKYPTSNVGSDHLLLKRRIYLKFYFWSNFFVLFIIILIIAFGLSFLLGLFSFIALILTTRIFLRRISASKSRLLFSYCLPSSLALLPVILFVLQVVLDKPLTKWSRNKAIQNSNELIAKIEEYKDRHGVYPLTLNAINKDYSTGITGIEKYNYTYDNSTFNIYFEQPRFFFDQVGTREFVVYNPNDNHLMMSHTAWFMELEPHQIRNTQGWYESVETGVIHWKSFLFD